ncbi:O-antigen ligase family protein [Maribacter sp. 4G9]|uniref:O-antigen ligase family protein n=1 Tax=Maribacter sp. 4G9 TaxID=1889777 RepID=UPI000C15D5BB|nr:O-antigen ligase family protein [Maribacter sp. 4G9]PIB23382.1 hypothetical protein BFP75_10265 [Maribacter sp. 4G9]
MDIFKKIDFLSLSLGFCIGILPWSERWNTIAIIYLALYLIYKVFLLKTKIKFKIWEFIAASALFWISLLWLQSTDDFIMGWKYMERISSALVFPLLFSWTLTRFTFRLQLVLLIFLASCILRYFFLLSQIIDWELVYILDYWKEVLIQFNQISLNEALHPSYFSLYLGFCVLISYFFLSKALNFKYRFVWLTLLVFFFLTVISLGAKMPLIACVLSLMIGMLFKIYRMKSGRQKYLIVAFASILAVIVFVIKAPNGIQQDMYNYYSFYKGEDLHKSFDYEKYGTNYSLETWSRTNRIFIWKSSVQLVKKNFLAGVGTGDMRNELNKQYLEDGQVYLANKNTNTHNQFLDFLVKFGLIGFLLIVISFWFYLYSAWTGNNTLYFMFLVFLLMCMLTENILNRQLGISFFFFFNSLFLFSKKGNRLV